MQFSPKISFFFLFFSLFSYSDFLPHLQTLWKLNYTRARISIKSPLVFRSARPLVSPSVGPSVGLSVGGYVHYACVKKAFFGIFWPRRCPALIEMISKVLWEARLKVILRSVDGPSVPLFVKHFRREIHSQDALLPDRACFLLRRKMKKKTWRLITRSWLSNNGLFFSEAQCCYLKDDMRLKPLLNCCYFFLINLLI